MTRRPRYEGFTLVEILVVAGIILTLAAILIPSAKNLLQRSDEALAVNHLRSIGGAIQNFGNDNDGHLPLNNPSGDLWPILLIGYLDNDTKYYAEPNSATNFQTLKVDPLSNTENRTSYVLNSFDDLGGRAAKFVNIDAPSDTILLAAQYYRPGNFLMDIDRQDYARLVNARRYHDGSYYLFADGSARFIPSAEYGARLWLADKTYEVQ